MTADRDPFDNLLLQMDRQRQRTDEQVSRAEQQMVLWTEWAPRIEEHVLRPLQEWIRDVEEALRRPAVLADLEREMDSMDNLSQTMKTSRKGQQFELINYLLAYVLIPAKRLALLALVAILVILFLVYLPEIASWFSG
jgi:hypothetical protein